MRIVHSLLHTIEIELIVRKYFGLNTTKCQLLRSYKNDIYKVSSFEKKYIFKIYDLSKIEESVAFEVSFLGFLKASGVSVNEVIKTTSNKEYVSIRFPEGVRFAVLYTFEIGNELDYRKTGSAFMYGKCVAEFHLISKDYKLKDSNNINLGLDLSNAVNVIESFFEAYQISQRPKFKEFFHEITTSYSHIDKSLLQMGNIHGDLHGGNILKNGETLTLVDFEYSGYGFIGYELSVFRWGTLIANRDSQWDEYLNGYCEISSINDRELQFSMLMACIRDVLIMANTVALAYKFGALSVHDYYIQNRLVFLDKMVKNLNI